MAKKRLTGHVKEIHKQAVAIRKRVAAMPDGALVELSQQIEDANFAKVTEERVVVEQSETIINRVAEFLDELEHGAVSGVGVTLTKKMRELAQAKEYI